MAKEPAKEPTQLPPSEFVVRPSQHVNVMPPLRQQFAEAPVLFVDGIQGFGLTAGNVVRINWVQDRIGSPLADGSLPPEIAERHVVLRMMMTVDQFKMLQKWMELVVSDLDQRVQSAVEAK